MGSGAFRLFEATLAAYAPDSGVSPEDREELRLAAIDELLAFEHDVVKVVQLDFSGQKEITEDQTVWIDPDVHREQFHDGVERDLVCCAFARMCRRLVGTARADT